MNPDTGQVYRVPEEISEEEARANRGGGVRGADWLPASPLWKGYPITDKHPTDYMNRRERREWQAQQRKRSVRKHRA